MSYEWDVTRCTTDKLAAELNDFAWDIHQIQFLGGRDWVIITRQAIPETVPTFRFLAFVKHDKDSRYWEIEIPSVGASGETVVTQSRSYMEIETMAKEALAVTLNIDPEEIAVDIETR